MFSFETRKFSRFYFAIRNNVWLFYISKLFTRMFKSYCHSEYRSYIIHEAKRALVISFSTIQLRNTFVERQLLDTILITILKLSIELLVSDRLSFGKVLLLRYTSSLINIMNAYWNLLKGLLLVNTDCRRAMTAVYNKSFVRFWIGNFCPDNRFLSDVGKCVSCKFTMRKIIWIIPDIGLNEI